MLENMYLPIKCGLVLILAVSTFAEHVNITRNYGQLHVYFNQTSWGWYRWVQGDQTLANVSSIWMQDDLNKRLRIDVGTRGQPGFMAEYYFFSDQAYVVTPGTDTTVNCAKIPDANYTSEVITYGEPNFGFLGRHIMAEYGGVMADLYVGQAQDAAGPLNCLLYCDSLTCSKYLGMVVTGVVNKWSFSEYWYGDNLQSVVPPASYFDVPQECDDAEIEYFYEKHSSDGAVESKSKKKTNLLFYRPFVAV